MPAFFVFTEKILRLNEKLNTHSVTSCNLERLFK
jgi:hypothetical protein